MGCSDQVGRQHGLPTRRLRYSSIGLDRGLKIHVSQRGYARTRVISEVLDPDLLTTISNTHLEDAGIASCHSRGCFSMLQGPKAIGEVEYQGFACTKSIEITELS